VPVHARSRGARRPSGELVAWPELARTRVGLLTSLARPERVVRLLASHHVVPRAILTFPDHARARFPRTGGAERVDVWLVPPKCAVSLDGAPVDTLVLDHEPDAGDDVRAALGVMLDPSPSGSYLRKVAVKLLPHMVFVPKRSA
jgi:hypothetical protein